MRIQNVLHRHRVIGQQPVGRRLLRTPREDRRQMFPKAIDPGRTHQRNPAPDPAVGMGAATVFPGSPSPRTIERSGPAENPFRTRAQNLVPTRHQRPEPDRAPHTRTPPRRQFRAALPPRRPVAQAGLSRPGETLHKHRTLAVGRRPVIGNPARSQAQDPGGKTLHTDTGKQQEAMVAHDLGDVGHAGISRPADDAVARTKLDPGRGEADAPQHPVVLRTDPVPDLPARRAAPSLRMPALDHRLPAAAVLRCRHQLKRQGTEVPKRARDRTVGEVRRGTGMGIEFQRFRFRKTHTQILRKRRQKLARRRKAQLANTVVPVLPLAELVGQRRS